MAAKFGVLFLLIAVVYGEKIRYDNYQVHRVVPQNAGQLHILKYMQEQADGLDFWREPGKVNSSVDIMVSPKKLPEFLEVLRSANMKSKPYMKNVQEAIDNEQRSNTRADFGWTSYYGLEDIYAWLDSLVEQYPGVVTSIVGGSTYEQREIRGVKVSYKEGNPGVFVEGGIHAREWIGPATVTYILNQLLTSTDAAIRDIAENYDWYILPSFNPDGYVYTHTTDRMWRKTRSPSGEGCYGADPNRNWGFHWMDGGASSNPCIETYGGSSAFSEIETKSLSEYITSISDKIQVYLAFHSFSQLLLIPYGFNNDHISNYDTLMDIGMKAKESLAQRYGTDYEVGNIVDVIYVASGGSMDWVRGTFDTPITYTYELRDTGMDGFILPPEQIIPTGEETLDSVVTILQEAKNVIGARG